MRRRTHNLINGERERGERSDALPISHVGFPFLFFAQNTKTKTAVKLTAVSCAPVVEVKIKRPDTKYQLGFSVQNGVVSSAFFSLCDAVRLHSFLGGKKGGRNLVQHGTTFPVVVPVCCR